MRSLKNLRDGTGVKGTGYGNGTGRELGQEIAFIRNGTGPGRGSNRTGVFLMNAALGGISVAFFPAAKPTDLAETNFLSSSSKKMQLMDVLNLLTTNSWARIDGRSLSSNLLTMNKFFQNSSKILKNHPKINFFVSLHVSRRSIRSAPCLAQKRRQYRTRTVPR